MAHQRFRSIPGFSQDDMESELLEVLWLAVNRYDPNQGATFKTFFDRLVNNRMRDLVRAAFRQNRIANTYCEALDTDDVRSAVEQLTAEHSAEDHYFARWAVEEHARIR